MIICVQRNKQPELHYPQLYNHQIKHCTAIDRSKVYVNGYPTLLDNVKFAYIGVVPLK